MTTIKEIAAEIVETQGAPYYFEVDDIRYVTYIYPASEAQIRTWVSLMNQKNAESQQDNNTIYMKTDARRNALHAAMDMAKIQVGMDVLAKADEIYNWLTKDL